MARNIETWLALAGGWVVPNVRDYTLPVHRVSKITPGAKTPCYVRKDGTVCGVPKWPSENRGAYWVPYILADARHGYGIVCKVVRAIDIDVDDATKVAELCALVDTTLGVTTIKRKRRWCDTSCALPQPARCTCLFQCYSSHAFKKHTIPLEAGGIDVLVDSQYCALNGVKVSKTEPASEFYVEWPAEMPVASVEKFTNTLAALYKYARLPVEKLQRAYMATGRELSHSTTSIGEYVATCIEAACNVVDRTPTRLYITCPWEHEHTCYSGPRETMIQLPTLKGPGFFKCQHAHCASRSIYHVLQRCSIDMDYLRNALIAEDFEHLMGRTPC